MPGEDKQITDQKQVQFGTTANTLNSSQSGANNVAVNSATGPWEPAKAGLNRLIESYNGLSTAVTPEQAAAAESLKAGAGAIPGFGPQAAGAATNLFGSSTAPQVGMLNKALADYQKNIGATASGANLDPMATPGFGDALNTTMNDITNRVKGVYAGSGRDPSGAGSFAKSLGRGLTEGTAPVIAAEAARLRGEQQGAARSLYDAGGGTAGAITSQNQVPLTNQTQAVGLLPQIMQSFTAPGTAQAAAADYAQSQPFGNLQKLLAPLLQLGAAGTQTAGTTAGTTNTVGSGANTGTTQSLGIGHGETVQPQNLMSNIMGGVSGGIGLLSLLSDGTRRKA